jgi:Domain of unknown function (DUF6898)
MAVQQDTEVLLEFHRVGAVVKVTAVDPVSLTEVCISGPASAGQSALGQAAIRKLRYVLTRRAAERRR